MPTLSSQFIYVICRLGGPYGEKLWTRAWAARGHSFSLYGPTLCNCNNNIDFIFTILKRPLQFLMFKFHFGGTSRIALEIASPVTLGLKIPHGWCRQYLQSEPQEKADRSFAIGTSKITSSNNTNGSPTDRLLISRASLHTPASCYTGIPTLLMSPKMQVKRK